jgi:formylglycine-generating enzyme required for sulfatase activity
MFTAVLKKLITLNNAAKNNKNTKRNVIIMAALAMLLVIFLIHSMSSKPAMVLVKDSTLGIRSNYGLYEDVLTITSNNFYIGKYEVTQKEWQQVMGNNPSFLKKTTYL